MTSGSSLFASSAADVTLDRVRELVDQGLREGLTLDYKQQYTTRVLDTIASMANSYGGLIFVGVTDKAPRRLEGVTEAEATKIANACTTLEPPWVPEIIPVSLDSTRGTWILVVRVDAARAPRPVLLEGRVRVRLHDRKATADRGQLARLFAEAGTSTYQARYKVPAPSVPRGTNGEPEADFVMRTGMYVPLGEAASRRPFSERVVEELAGALNLSPVGQRLAEWSSEFGCTGINLFHRRGFNRAHYARIVWQAPSTHPTVIPVEAVLDAHLPSPQPGGDPTGPVEVTLDLVVRARQFIAAYEEKGSHLVWPTPWRLPIGHLYKTADSMAETLASAEIISVLADLAGIDRVLVPPPACLHFVGGPPFPELLAPTLGLISIEEAGVSYGAHLAADPSLDLAEPTERRQQIDAWLGQLALDSGLRGMENVLERYHAADP